MYNEFYKCFCKFSRSSNAGAVSGGQGNLVSGIANTGAAGAGGGTVTDGIKKEDIAIGSGSSGASSGAGVIAAGMPNYSN